MGVPSIILAGGKSTRMGRDKATLIWKNKTWIEHIVKALEKSNCTPIIISVDSQNNIEALQQVVKNKDIIWVKDDDEFGGMKGGLISSLKMAIEKG
jgi:molybdopterin-guanine dinucleotide biosynthesis protein A